MTQATIYRGIRIEPTNMSRVTRRETKNQTGYLVYLPRVVTQGTGYPHEFATSMAEAKARIDALNNWKRYPEAIAMAEAEGDTARAADLANKQIAAEALANQARAEREAAAAKAKALADAAPDLLFQLERLTAIMENDPRYSHWDTVDARAAIAKAGGAA